MFCTVIVVCIHILYCDNGMCKCFVLSQWYARKSLKSTAFGVKRAYD
jgi:hypothetical protein